MNNSIRIGIYQHDIIWNNIQANQSKIDSLIFSLSTKPEILILPEMYTTGFNGNPLVLPEKEIVGQLKWQLSVSEKYSLALLGSVIEYSNNIYYNRLYFTLPDGSYDYYDKRHLFGMGGESDFYTAGTSRKVFSYNTIRLMPQVCYDLRFPVWSRNNMNYHLLIYSANWPATRSFVWDTLLKARAIENQCYVIGVNRVGTDGNSIKYIGKSAVYGPKGETILYLDDKVEYREVLLSIDELMEFRKTFPVLSDADNFEIKTRKQ
jgi:omega-amidase